MTDEASELTPLCVSLSHAVSLPPPPRSVQGVCSPASPFARKHVRHEENGCQEHCDHQRKTEPLAILPSLLDSLQKRNRRLFSALKFSCLTQACVDKMMFSK